MNDLDQKIIEDFKELYEFARKTIQKRYRGSEHHQEQLDYCEFRALQSRLSNHGLYEDEIITLAEEEARELF